MLLFLVHQLPAHVLGSFGIRIGSDQRFDLDAGLGPLGTFEQRLDVRDRLVQALILRRVTVLVHLAPQFLRQAAIAGVARDLIDDLVRAVEIHLLELVKHRFSQGLLLLIAESNRLDDLADARAVIDLLKTPVDVLECLGGLFHLCAVVPQRVDDAGDLREHGYQSAEEDE